MSVRPVVFENHSIKIEAELRGETLILRPAGSINEDVNFNQLFDAINQVYPRAVVFDLGEVTEINSCGVRAWLLFIERVQAIAQMGFIKIGEVMIEQANVVSNILGKSGTPVVAFDAPYFCAKCNARTIRLLKVNDIKAQGMPPTAPPLKCDKCGTALEFDAVEQEYFRFLDHTKGN